MSRIRNATDGLLLFRTALRAFNERHKPRIEQIRRKFSDNPLGKPPADFEDLLEAHVRKYLIDALLGALNWNIVLRDDPEATNLIPEAPIVSVTHATTRYLDYFGMEHGTGQALLIVESKRLGTLLPQREKSTPARKIGVSSRDMAEIILDGLKGDELLHNWNEWLKTLKDYFVSVRDRGQSAPRRVVITDGIWCVIFLEPEITLLNPDRSTPEHIAVYLSKESAEAGKVFETHFDEIFGYLEYRCLARQLRSLMFAELTFHLPPGTQTTMMRGLHLKYLEVEELYSTKPRIQVSPLLFMRVEGREWLRVEARTPEYVPTNEDDLVQHLEKVRARAQQLSDDVTSVLEKKPTWLSIEDHYSDEASFGLLHGVSKTDRQNEFVLITGSESHYLRKEPTVLACPFHDWQKGVSVGEQYPEAGPLSLPSINPRAFFATPGLHHCAHRQVHAAKSSPITEANRQHCGSRSGADNAAFCEIWPFEHHLCCRTCVFEDVCTKASVFHLPCKRLDGAHNGCHCGTSTSHLIAGEVKMTKQPSE